MNKSNRPGFATMAILVVSEFTSFIVVAGLGVAAVHPLVSQQSPAQQVAAAQVTAQQVAEPLQDASVIPESLLPSSNQPDLAHFV